MGTFLYVILKLFHVIDHPDDLINICHLVAIDSITFALLLQIRFNRRKS